jgi:hypothetical protein
MAVGSQCPLSPADPKPHGGTVVVDCRVRSLRVQDRLWRAPLAAKHVSTGIRSRSANEPGTCRRAQEARLPVDAELQHNGLDHVRDPAALVVAEIVGNVIRHTALGRPPPGRT